MTCIDREPNISTNTILKSLEDTDQNLGFVLFLAIIHVSNVGEHIPMEGNG